MEPICEICHQPLLPSYYFCPNCGQKVNDAPLGAGLQAQAYIYFLSAILPLIGFLAISKWHAIKYLKSKDPKTKKIGIIACVILALSTIITIYLAYVWTEAIIQSSINSLNADMGF